MSTNKNKDTDSKTKNYDYKLHESMELYREHPNISIAKMVDGFNDTEKKGVNVKEHIANLRKIIKTKKHTR